MATVRLPLVVQAHAKQYNTIGLSDPVVEDAVLQAVKNNVTQAQDIYIGGREAESDVGSPGSGDATAITPWLGKSAAHVAYAQGASNSVIYSYNGNATFTNLGTITGQGVQMSETTISGVPNIVVTSAAGSGRTWFYADGGSLTEITDADFPPKQSPAIAITGPHVHLNGRMYVMTTTGRIYAPDINSLSSWTLSNYLTADQKPDGGIGLARYGDLIAGFGVGSTELFRDAGNQSGSQLNRVENGLINVGCINQHGIVEWNNTVAFLGNTGTSGYGVYLLEGQQAKKISPDWVDNYLQFEVWGGGIPRLVTKQSHGHQYLIITSGALSPQQIVYHDGLGIWGTWLGNLAYKTAPVGPYNYVVGINTGIVVRNDPLVSAKNFRVLTAQGDLGTPHNKKINRISLIGMPVNSLSGYDISVTLYSGDYTSGNSVSKTLNLGTNRGRPYASRWGMARSLALEVKYAGGSATKTGPRFSAVEIDFDVCAT